MVEMRLSLLVISIFFVGVTFTFPANEQSSGAHAIQFAHSVNHKFQYEFDDLKSVLLADNIKDRQVVVVSVSGAFRKGKSFLLNFFLRYLYARYERHDVSDWIGEESSTKLTGFAWRGGRNRTTSGIQLWSDIFTHDYTNGEKVAIILLDTQGTFDRQSSVRESTTILALSILLSSVQCYNVMQNIQENDLQHLELFVEYARQASEQSDEKSFQHLLFIVRDWQNQFEVDFGWNGQQLIDEVLAEQPTYQTDDMRELRQRIRSSFANISAFLLPHPGRSVSTGQFTGDLNELDLDFKTYLKILVPSLFAPENLVVKTINGQKIRAQELVQYIEQYSKLFDGENLPEPKTVLQATAEVNNMALYNKALYEYLNSMDAYFGSYDQYYRNISEIHQQAKDKAIEQFQSKKKLGSAEMISKFQRALSSEISSKFEKFEATNEKIRLALIEGYKNHNAKLVNDIDQDYCLIMKALAEGVSDDDFIKKNAEIRIFAMTKFKENIPANIVHETLYADPAFDELRKDGDDIDENLASSYRIILLQNLDRSFTTMNSLNQSKREANERKGILVTGGATAAGAGVGAAIGAAVLGPVGAGAGFILGAVTGYLIT